MMSNRWVKGSGWLLLSFVLFILLSLLLPLLMGWNVHLVNSASMTPTVPQGSIAIIKPTELKDMQVGDITLLSNDHQELLLHRITEVRGTEHEASFQTKGDANEYEDFFEAQSEQMIGNLFFHFPYIGYLVLYLKEHTFMTILWLITLFIFINFRGWRGDQSVSDPKEIKVP